MLLARQRHDLLSAHGEDEVRPRLAFPLLGVLQSPPQAVVFLHSVRT